MYPTVSLLGIPFIWHHLTLPPSLLDKMYLCRVLYSKSPSGKGKDSSPLRLPLTLYILQYLFITWWQRRAVWHPRVGHRDESLCRRYTSYSLRSFLLRLEINLTLITLPSGQNADYRPWGIFMVDYLPPTLITIGPVIGMRCQDASPPIPFGLEGFD